MNVELYRRLFVHRSDVFARQHEDGSYMPVDSPITDVELEEHLEGFDSYGVYVIDPGTNQQVLPEKMPNTVKYAVFDLDTYDADALDFLKRATERLVGPAGLNWTSGNTHRQCLMLEDSGGKGYHVWLFLSEPVPAAKVRAWTETVRTQYVVLARTATPPWPALEIFPKQDAVTPGGYGNLVKLPFGVHAKTKARSYVVPVPGWATELEDVRPYEVALIPEPAVKPERKAGDGSSSGKAPFACISKILEDGASHADHNRDNALYHFCRYAVSCGLPDDLLASWAERVNEGFDPPLTDREVSTKVRSALSATTPNPGCSADWLRDYCPGGDRCFAPGNVRSGTSEEVQASDAYLSPEQRRAQRLRES